MRNFIYILTSIFTLIICSCKDSDTVSPLNHGSITATNLKPLDKNVDGVYEAWISIESSLDHEENAFRSVGKFNLTVNGAIVDTNGNPFTLNLSKITDINSTGDAIITIDPPGFTDTIPGDIKLIGGEKEIEGSDLVFNMTMDYDELLPLANQFTGAAGSYLLASPSTGVSSSQFKRGAWFSTDTNGNSAGLTLPIIPDTAEWTYQAWVIDSRDSINRIYDIGRFDSLNGFDSYNQCQGSFPGWHVPGQDWIQSNCPGGIPDITDLTNGFYRLVITLEPRFESGLALQKPFYLRLFYGNIPNSTFGAVQTLTNTSGSNMPTAKITLSQN